MMITLRCGARRRFWLIGLGLGGLLTPPACLQAQDTAHVFGNPAVWQWPPTRTYHVVNYRLALRFDEPAGEVFGDEVITLRPLTSQFSRFYVNSAGLTIDSVLLQRGHEAPIPLRYATSDPRLWVTLDRGYDRSDSLNVRIVYHGVPRTGLFFVNPTSSYPNWPPEVFSQGETEFNHYWFPCWDYPNDMATSETITTVPEGQMVVSNGALERVTHAGGLVTYDWVEHVPHSSYLISIAVGPWHKVADHYKDKPVDYYVLPDVDEATARRSFHLTPDMIRFFSTATGVDYPYEKYAQVAVKNYLFGGQENVSVTTLTEATLHDARAEADYPSTDLVSHELGQHWLGDYVQARDWADIWLNEGCATFLDALYAQHRGGYEAYRYAVYNDQLTEQAEDREQYRRPVVDHHYTDPMYMIDATTHQKGAAVLDMLRYVMDGASAVARQASQREEMLRALHAYLTTYATQAVGTADLVEAIRRTTGQELDWFFHEWVFMAGHPDYRIQAHYDSASHTEAVIVTQAQPTDKDTPIFRMPIELAFYGLRGQHQEMQVDDSLQRQEFDVPIPFEPAWVDFDPDDFVDKTVQFAQPVSALAAESTLDPHMMSRLWAVQQLGSKGLGDAKTQTDALARALGLDHFYGVRIAAATSLGELGNEEAKDMLLIAMRRQSDSRVRTAVSRALRAFAEYGQVFDVLTDALEHDPSDAVQSAAATALGRSGRSRAFDVLQAEVDKPHEIHVMQAIMGALGATDDPRAWNVLLTEAQPGVPERIRESALLALENFRGAVPGDRAAPLAAVVGDAVHDPVYPTQTVGVELVGVFDLHQFEGDIQRVAQTAPLIMGREQAEHVLAELRKR